MIILRGPTRRSRSCWPKHFTGTDDLEQAILDSIADGDQTAKLIQ
jgi:hypothetical protein